VGKLLENYKKSVVSGMKTAKQPFFGICGIRSIWLQVPSFPRARPRMCRREVLVAALNLIDRRGSLTYSKPPSLPRGSGSKSVTVHSRELPGLPYTQDFHGQPLTRVETFAVTTPRREDRYPPAASRASVHKSRK
jgi:hypothetical protein